MPPRAILRGRRKLTKNILNLPLEVQNIIFKDFSLKELLSIQRVCKEFKNIITRVLQDKYRTCISISFEDMTRRRDENNEFEQWLNEFFADGFVFTYAPTKGTPYELFICNDHMLSRMRNIYSSERKKICHVNDINYIDIKNVLKYFKNIVSIQYDLTTVTLNNLSYIAEHYNNLSILKIRNEVTDEQINTIVTKCKQLVYIFLNYNTSACCANCNKSYCCTSCDTITNSITPLGIEYILNNCHNIKKIDIFNCKIFNKIELQTLFTILDKINPTSSDHINNPVNFVIRESDKLLDLNWEIKCNKYLQSCKETYHTKEKIERLKKRKTMGKILYYKNHKYIKHNILDKNNSSYDKNKFGDILQFGFCNSQNNY